MAGSIKTALFNYLCNDLFATGKLKLLESIKENSTDILNEVDILCLCLDHVSGEIEDVLRKCGSQVLKNLQKRLLFLK